MNYENLGKKLPPPAKSFPFKLSTKPSKFNPPRKIHPNFKKYHPPKY